MNKQSRIVAGTKTAYPSSPSRSLAGSMAQRTGDNTTTNTRQQNCKWRSNTGAGQDRKRQDLFISCCVSLAAIVLIVVSLL